MNHADHVNLIRDGVAEPGGHWADLGAGEGAFTLALADLLGPQGHIVAVDKDRRALRALEGRVETLVADFRQPLNLRELDGVVMANSLHYLKDKDRVLRAVRAMLKAGGRLIVVEYGTDRGNAWVPYPFTYPQWEKLAERAGFKNTRLLSTVPSRWLGSMYAAVSHAGTALSPSGEQSVGEARSGAPSSTRLPRRGRG